MNPELSEEEMRRALFGDFQPVAQTVLTSKPEPAPEVSFTKPAAAQSTKKKTSKAFTPCLRVRLMVGNEFEGDMHELIHEADTLSKLQAELDAVKAARKKFRYVQAISVTSM